MSPEIEERIRVLWEETPQSAREIAAQYGKKPGFVTGVAWRRGWDSFNQSSLPWPYERTTMGRLDALNAKMDRILAETEPAIRQRVREAA